MRLFEDYEFMCGACDGEYDKMSWIDFGVTKHVVGDIEVCSACLDDYLTNMMRGA